MTKRIITDEQILKLKQVLDDVTGLIECNCATYVGNELLGCDGSCTFSMAEAALAELDTLPAISEPEDSDTCDRCGKAAPVAPMELGSTEMVCAACYAKRPQEAAPVPPAAPQEAASAPAFDLTPNFKAIFQQFARDAANAGEALSAGLYRAQFAPEYHWDKPETYRRRALVLRAVQEYLAPATIALQCATSMPDIERLREVMAKTLAEVNTWASEFEASAEAGEEN